MTFSILSYTNKVTNTNDWLFVVDLGPSPLERPGGPELHVLGDDVHNTRTFFRMELGVAILLE